jgi:hypothetical protein
LKGFGAVLMPADHLQSSDFCGLICSRVSIDIDNDIGLVAVLRASGMEQVSTLGSNSGIDGNLPRGKLEGELVVVVDDECALN